MPLLLLFMMYQKQRRIRYVFLTLAIVSLIASHYMSIKDTQSSFYLLPFRAWELLIGASIATIRGSKLSILKFPYFPTVGLAVVLTCFFVFDETTLHPSFYTLAPVIGVSIVLWFAGNNDIVSKILSSKIFVGIGLISYSLYLWHYPIFSFANHIEIFFNNNFVN